MLGFLTMPRPIRQVPPRVISVANALKRFLQLPWIGFIDHTEMNALKNPRSGIFITGTDTGVGKTYVGVLLTRALGMVQQ